MYQSFSVIYLSKEAYKEKYHKTIWQESMWLYSGSQMYKHRRNIMRYLQTAALYCEQNIFV